MVLNVVKGRCWVPMQQMFHYGLSAELQSFAIVDGDKSLGHCPIILVRERTEPIFEWAAKSKTVSLADSLKIILNLVKGRCWVPIQKMSHYENLHNYSPLPLLTVINWSFGHLPIIIIRQTTAPIFKGSAKSKHYL